MDNCEVEKKLNILLKRTEAILRILDLQEQRRKIDRELDKNLEEYGANPCSGYHSDYTKREDLNQILKDYIAKHD